MPSPKDDATQNGRRHEPIGIRAARQRLQRSTQMQRHLHTPSVERYSMRLKLRNFLDDHRHYEKLVDLLEHRDGRDVLYIYRLHSGEIIRPHLFADGTLPFSQLVDLLRDEFGGGDFMITIRRCRTILIIGQIGIWAPPGRAHTPSIKLRGVGTQVP
jgi:hypothetical protein